MRDRILEVGPRLRRAILLGTAAGVPIFFLRPLNGIFGASKLGLLMIGVIVVATVRALELSQGASTSGLSRLAVPSLALGIPLFAAWIASPYRYWSLFGWYPRFLGLIPYLFVILLGILVADAFAGRTTQLAWAMAVSATVVGGYGFVQLIGADPFEWRTAGAGSSVANSTLGNSNFAGTFLAMTFPFFPALWVLFHEQRRRLIGMSLFAVAGWVASLSEAAWVAGISGLVVIGAWIVAHRWGWMRLVGLLAAGLGTFVLIGVVLYRVLYTETIDSITYRGWWWEAAADMASRSPLLGRGPAAFAVEGLRFRPLEDAVLFGYGFPDDPHSVVMQLLTSAGIVGVLGFLLVLGWAIRKGFSMPSSQVLPAAFFASVVAYFVNSVTTIDEISLRVGLWTVLGGLAASLVVVRDKNVIPRSSSKGRARAPANRSAKSPRTRGKGRPLKSWPTVMGLALAGLSGLVWSLNFVVADARIHQGQQLFAEGHVAEGRREFETAIGFRGDYAYRNLYGLNLGSQAVGRGEEGGALIEEMSSAFSFVDHFPFVPSHADYGLKLYEWGEFDETAYQQALAIFERVRRFDPLNPMLGVHTADTLIALGRHNEAIDLLAPFTDEAGGRYAELWGALALAYFHTGDLEAAQAAVDEGSLINAGDERLVEARALLDKAAE